MSLVQSPLPKQRRLASSGSRRVWWKAVGLSLLLAGVGCAYSFVGALSPIEQIALAALLLIVLAIAWRRSSVSLLGPTFLYDLIRTTRRTRFALYRMYAYFACGLLALFYLVWFMQHREGERPLSMRDVAFFGQVFCYCFLGLQILAVALLTPAYTADVLADEKERRTLDFIMSTDLHNREIVFSKLAGRLANLLLMLLTGLPIASIVELMGGVQPELVVLGFSIAAITAVSLSAVSLLFSLYARRTRSAILLTYFVVGLYVMTSLSVVSLWRAGPVIVFGINSLEVFTAGDPVLQLMGLVRDLETGGRLADSLIYRLENYATFHGLLTVVCVIWAVLRLRAVFLRQADGESSRARRRLRWTLRPKIGSHPMLWKEIFIERSLRLGWLGKLLIAGGVVGSFFTLYGFYDSMAPNGGIWLVPYVITFWSMVMGAMVACLLLLITGVHAANAITGERDRMTFDGLLATPLTSNQMLLAKLIGSVLSVRWGWLWLGTIWGAGILAGILGGAVFPLWALAWLLAALLLSLIGLWFSLVSRTGTRAMMHAILCAIVWAIAPVVPYQYWIIDDYSRYQDWARWWYTLQLGLSPPAVFGYLIPYWRPGVTEPSPRGPTNTAWYKDPLDLQSALLGMAVWTAAAALLWCLIRYRFRKATGR